MGELFTLIVLGWFNTATIAEPGIHRLHVVGIGLFVTISLLRVAIQLYQPRDHPGALIAAVAVCVMATVMLAMPGSDP